MRVTGAFRAMSGPSSPLSAAAAGSVFSSLGGAGGRFVLQVALAQLLGTNTYGIFVTFRGWGELLSTLPNRGHQGTVVRYLPVYAETGARSLYRGLLGYALKITSVGGLGLALVALAVATTLTDEPWLAVASAAATIPAWALLRLLQSVLQAQHKFVPANFLVQMFQPLVLAVLLAAIWLLATVNLGSALLALFVSILLAAAIAAQIVRSAGRTTDQRSPETEIPVWRQAARFFYVGQLANTVIIMADLLILALFVSPVEVALYSVASRIAILGRLVNSGIESVVAPRIAEAWSRGDVPGLQKLVTAVIAISTGPTIAIAVALVLLREPVLGIVGEDYRSAGTILAILLIGNVINALTGPTGYVLSTTGNEKVHSQIMAATASGLVLACFLVAGPAGAVGVAVVRTMATASWNVAIVRYAKRHLGVRCYLRPGQEML